MWILAVSGHFSTILCLGLGVEKCIEKYSIRGRVLWDELSRLEMYLNRKTHVYFPWVLLKLERLLYIYLVCLDLFICNNFYTDKTIYFKLRY